VRNPFDGSTVAQVRRAGADDMDAAIAIASASRRAARQTPSYERARVLSAVASRLRNEGDPVARQIALEAGKPIRFARGEVERAALTFELAAANALSLGSESVPIDVDPRGVGRVCVTRQAPRGVVGAITPFNFPLNLVAHKIAPAIAVGAPFVLKPAPQCPLSSLELARWVLEAGWPRECVSVLPCESDVAQRLVEDPRVAVLTFTGSDAVGWRLKSLAGKKQVLLELGGNAPCIVDETVDVAKTAEAIALSAFAYGGQVCIKTQRAFVHRSHYEEFLARLVESARSLVCGDPLDESVSVGPLISEAHVARVLEWIEEARAGGARIHCGAEREGAIVRPTVLTGAPRASRVVCDEVFGPVLVVEPFDDFSAALAACNDSRFGLQAGVFTADLGRALQAQRELEYGGVIVNDTPTLRIDSFPYGGAKDSGIGREGVRSTMLEYCEPRVWILRGAP